MKKAFLLIFAVTCVLFRSQAQDITRLEAVGMPIKSSVDYSTGKPVGKDLILRLSVLKSDDMTALAFLIFEPATEQTFAEYVAPVAKAVIDNKTTQKGQLTGKSELTLALPKDTQSNAVFIFRQYFQGNNLVGMRVTEYDTLTDKEKKTYFIEPSLDLFPNTPQGDPYYGIVAVLLRAQDEGIIDQIKDITEQK